MIDVLHPTQILCYGKIPEEYTKLVVPMGCFWQEIRRKEESIWGSRSDRGDSFGPVTLDLMGAPSRGEVSPIITAGLTELQGNEADVEGTLQTSTVCAFNDLNHEQLFVVDSQGFVLKKGFDGDKGKVSFDVSSAETWTGLTVTHRHPDEFGGTFSVPDITNMIRF